MVYIVDIDGTLANIEHRLHFIQATQKNWDAFFDACGGDTPILNVIQVIRSLGRDHEEGEREFIYLTGRPERVRNVTQQWLIRHKLPKGELLMRRDGDHRPDTIAKKELMDQLQAQGKLVVGVFEDRPSVVRVWREMGLTVFQMTHEEF